MKTKVRTLAIAVVFSLGPVLGQGAASAQDEAAHHPNPPAPCRTLSGHYAFRMVPAKSFAADRFHPGDDPAGLAGAPQQDILRVGVFTVKNDCSVLGHTIATTDDNAGATKIIDFNWAGAVTTVHPDGTGRLSVNPADNEVINSCVDGSGAAVGGCAAFEGPEKYAFVFNKHSGKSLELIQIDNDGGGAKIFLTGRAERRS
jgi:hypothetical protein